MEGFSGRDSSFGMPEMMNTDADALNMPTMAQTKDAQQGKKSEICLSSNSSGQLCI